MLDRIRRHRCSSSHSSRNCSHSRTAVHHSSHCCNCRTEEPPPQEARDISAVNRISLNWGNCATHTPRPPNRRYAVTPTGGSRSTAAPRDQPADVAEESTTTHRGPTTVPWVQLPNRRATAVNVSCEALL